MASGEVVRTRSAAVPSVITTAVSLRVVFMMNRGSGGSGRSIPVADVQPLPHIDWQRAVHRCQQTAGNTSKISLFSKYCSEVTESGGCGVSPGVWRVSAGAVGTRRGAFAAKSAHSGG